MINEKNFKECSRRYNEIYKLLYRAYVDLAIVQAISAHQLTIKDRNNSFSHTISHFCLLAYQDATNVIWKLGIDDDARANTLNSLKDLINDNRKAFDIGEQKEAIDKIRNKFLDHNDIDKSCIEDIQIGIETLEELLLKERRYLNSLYCTKLDGQATLLTNETIKRLNKKYKTGIDTLIEGAQLLLRVKEITK